MPSIPLELKSENGLIKVSSQLVSDVKLGCQLSEEDSSLVTWLANTNIKMAALSQCPLCLKTSCSVRRAILTELRKLWV